MAFQPLLEARGLAAVTPDGIPLFSDLDLVLERRVVALVGRNGTGKSTLGRILAGHRVPDAGTVIHHGRVGWLSQEIKPEPTARIIDLLGVAPVWSALRRIQAGECVPADFDTVGERWDLESDLRVWLTRFGLEHLPLNAPACRCSGGELTRLGLIRLLLDAPDLLILDEPTNHLDGTARRRLEGFLEEWQGGALVITHDRALLQRMACILELSSLGLASYPGPWSAYRDAKARERAAAEHRYETACAAWREQKQRRQMALERQQRRQSQGRKARREANQATILLDFSAQSSEATAARLRRQHAERVEEAEQRVREARQALEVVTPIVISIPTAEVVRGRRVLAVKDLSMGFDGRMLFEGLSFELLGGERLVVSGDNGTGKSVLLSLIQGLRPPLGGQVEVFGTVRMLDQHQSLLDDAQGALENFRRLAPGLDEAAYRTRLARLGLTGDTVQRPVAVLSGGERLKLAMACVLLGPRPPDLLLLDEPTNHQDLESTEALEAALRDYQGSLVLVSHDRHFMEQVGFTHELALGGTRVEMKEKG